MNLLAESNRPPRFSSWRHGERMWWAAALSLLLLVGSIGCNPITQLNFLLMPWMDGNDPAACSLAIEGKESKVVIIAVHEDVEPNLRFKGADEELMRRLTSLLEQRYKENGDKIKVVPTNKVLNYVQSHHEWVTLSKAELGKHFDADFVVFLELGPMTMYEEGSRGSLYRGVVEIALKVIDVNQPEGQTTKWQDVYPCTYPSRGPEDAGSMRPATFKFKFLDHVAKDLVLYFAAHPPKDKLED